MEKKGNSDHKKYQWRFLIGSSILVAATALVIYSWSAHDPDPEKVSGWTVLATATLLALVWLFLGGLLGFLFAIPRTRFDEDAKYAANTNLEQISDWLTKILVGLGLTQIGEVPSLFWSTAETYEKALGGAPSGTAVGLTVILFFLISGFLYGYLWTRIYMRSALRQADLEDVEAQRAADIDALAQVERFVAGDPDDPVTLEQVRNAIQSATVAVRKLIYNFALQVRRENAVNAIRNKGKSVDKDKLKATIPVFEALIGHDEGVCPRHRLWAQVGYAQRDLEQWKDAITSFEKAIDAREEARSFPWYEANRAACRIMLNDEFNAGMASTDDFKKKILADLKAVPAEKRSGFDRDPTLKKWLQSNGITQGDLFGVTWLPTP